MEIVDRVQIFEITPIFLETIDCICNSCFKKFEVPYSPPDILHPIAPQLSHVQHELNL